MVKLPLAAWAIWLESSTWSGAGGGGTGVFELEPGLLQAIEARLRGHEVKVPRVPADGVLGAEGEVGRDGERGDGVVGRGCELGVVVVSGRPGLGEDAQDPTGGDGLEEELETVTDGAAEGLAGVEFAGDRGSAAGGGMGRWFLRRVGFNGGRGETAGCEECEQAGGEERWHGEGPIRWHFPEWPGRAMCAARPVRRAAAFVPGG